MPGHPGDATNHNLEFGGPGLASVPMNDRRTIATQGAEISADFTTFGFDDRCAEFLAAHDAGGYHPADPDPGAVYSDVRTIDLSALEPSVTGGCGRRGRRAASGCPAITGTWR